MTIIEKFCIYSIFSTYVTTNISGLQNMEIVNSKHILPARNKFWKFTFTSKPLQVLKLKLIEKQAFHHKYWHLLANYYKYWEYNQQKNKRIIISIKIGAIKKTNILQQISKIEQNVQYTITIIEFYKIVDYFL